MTTPDPAALAAESAAARVESALLAAGFALAVAWPRPGSGGFGSFAILDAPGGSPVLVVAFDAPVG